MPESSVAAPERRPQDVDVDGWPILPPTLVSVHRTSPRDERSRQVLVTFDGRRVAELLYGQ